MILLAGSLMAAAVDFGIQVIVVRYLSKGDFGAWSYALAIVALLATIGQLEMRQVIARFLPEYLSARDTGRARGAVVLASAVVLGFCAILVVLVVVVIGLLGFQPTADPQARGLLLLLVVLVPLQALDGLLTGCFAALGAPRAILLRQSVLGPALRAIAVGLVIAAGGPVEALAVGAILATGIGVAVYAASLRRLLRERLADADRAARHRARPAMAFPMRELTVFGASLLTSTVVWTLIESSDAVLLGWFAGTDAVASFRVVLPLARLNQLAAATFGVLYLSRAAYARARGDDAGGADLYWRTALWMTLLTLPIFIGTVSFAPSVTAGVYGDAYAESAPILAILATGYFISTALGFNGQTLKLHGRLRYMALVDLSMVATNIAVNLALIPAFGAVGAAVGTALTLVAHNFLKQIGLARHTGIGALPARMLVLYAAIGAVAAALALVQLALPNSLLLAIVMSGAAGIAGVLLFRRRLGIDTVFPEIRRMPLPGWLGSWLWATNPPRRR